MHGRLRCMGRNFKLFILHSLEQLQECHVLSNRRYQMAIIQFPIHTEIRYQENSASLLQICEISYLNPDEFQSHNDINKCPWITLIFFVFLHKSPSNWLKSSHRKYADNFGVKRRDDVTICLRLSCPWSWSLIFELHECMILDELDLSLFNRVNW